jgi:hypothetical protein
VPYSILGSLDSGAETWLILLEESARHRPVTYDLNVPKSLDDAPSRTSAFAEIQFINFTMSSSLIARVRRRSLGVRGVSGEGVSNRRAARVTRVVYAEDYFFNLLPLAVGIACARFGLEFSNQFTEFALSHFPHPLHQRFTGLNHAHHSSFFSMFRRLH